MLVRHLPTDSATVHALEPRASWSVAEHLLASILDTLAHANWLAVEVNKRKGSRNPHPEPTPRPGDVKPEPKRLTGAELADWLGRVG